MIIANITTTGINRTSKKGAEEATTRDNHLGTTITRGVAITRADHEITTTTMATRRTTGSKGKEIIITTRGK